MAPRAKRAAPDDTDAALSVSPRPAKRPRLNDGHVKERPNTLSRSSRSSRLGRSSRAITRVSLPSEASSIPPAPRPRKRSRSPNSAVLAGTSDQVDDDSRPPKRLRFTGHDDGTPSRKSRIPRPKPQSHPRHRLPQQRTRTSAPSPSLLWPLFEGHGHDIPGDDNDGGVSGGSECASTTSSSSTPITDRSCRFPEFTDEEAAEIEWTREEMDRQYMMTSRGVWTHNCLFPGMPPARSENASQQQEPCLERQSPWGADLSHLSWEWELQEEHKQRRLRREKEREQQQLHRLPSPSPPRVYGADPAADEFGVTPIELELRDPDDPRIADVFGPEYARAWADHLRTLPDPEPSEPLLLYTKDAWDRLNREQAGGSFGRESEDASLAVDHETRETKDTTEANEGRPPADVRKARKPSRRHQVPEPLHRTSPSISPPLPRVSKKSARKPRRQQMQRETSRKSPKKVPKADAGDGNTPPLTPPKSDTDAEELLLLASQRRITRRQRTSANVFYELDRQGKPQLV